MILRHWQRKERHTQEGGAAFLVPCRGNGRKLPPGDRPQEPQEGGKQAEGLPGGEIPAGTSEGQNKPQSAEGIGGNIH